MRLDSHQHFWKYNSSDYVWMSDAMDVLRRDYLPEELETQLRSIGFNGTIAVQARQMIEETEWLLELADRHEFIRGVVGWVDFASDHLDRQFQTFSAHPKLKGVRELIHDMEDIEYAISDTHVRAIAKLAEYGLTYDLLLRPPHIRPAIELVRQFPDQPFVLDHIAKPAITDRETSPWQEDVRRLADYPHVFCKLSGMVTEAKWHAWEPEEFHPYLEVVLDAFGYDRVMIGSDWPVCTLSGDYVSTMRVVLDFLEPYPPEVREAILGGNCARFYSIN